ncbi:MAG: ribulose-phosphate 3-epimerase [Candidatus Baltobacteraceae bacterium]
MKLAPSLLSADFARISAEISAVVGAGADYLHLDVMDGRFVPNITWGPKIIGDLRALTDLPFDAHLMIVEPERYVESFVAAGANIVTFHLEATPHAQRLLAHLRSLGVKAGIAIDPQTPVGALVDIVEDCDLILIMSVNPGFGGQSFLERSLVKIREARALVEQRNPHCEIEVDGGINARTLPLVAAAGADVAVMGSAVFDGTDPAARLRSLRALLAK